MAVDEELVEAVARALAEYEYADGNNEPWEPFAGIARAVIPLIVERCAKVADSKIEVTQAFEREERYIVIKRKDLSAEFERRLRRELSRFYGVDTVDCVVIEGDWPEYEAVWAMLEARVTGSLSSEQSSKAEVEQLTEARDFYAGLYADRCGLLLERDTRIASLEARVAELEAGLSKCREVFAEYAEMHRRKLGSERPLDSFEHQAIIRKVERNRDMADLCIALLNKRSEPCPK